MAGFVEALVKTYIDREDATGWAFVRRVPSTHTWKIVDHLRALDGERRSRICRASADKALQLLGGTGPTIMARSEVPDDDEFPAAVLRAWDWQYASVRTLRAVLGDQLGKRPSPEFADTPVEVLARAQSIRPTNAREIRKEVKTALGERFGARASNPLGDWKYEGSHRGREFVLNIDYGGWDQLRYDVEYADVKTGLHARRLTYERLVGAGLGNWDFVTADNLVASVALLCELVEILVELPDHL
jgi:hypothetical protein